MVTTKNLILFVSYIFIDFDISFLTLTHTKIFMKNHYCRNDLGLSSLNWNDFRLKKSLCSCWSEQV